MGDAGSYFTLRDAKRKDICSLQSNAVDSVANGTSNATKGKALTGALPGRARDIGVGWVFAPPVQSDGFDSQVCLRDDASSGHPLTGP